MEWSMSRLSNISKTKKHVVYIYFFYFSVKVKKLIHFTDTFKMIER